MSAFLMTTFHQSQQSNWRRITNVMESPFKTQIKVSEHVTDCWRSRHDNDEHEDTCKDEQQQQKQQPEKRTSTYSEARPMFPRFRSGILRKTEQNHTSQTRGKLIFYLPATFPRHLPRVLVSMCSVLFSKVVHVLRDSHQDSSWLVSGEILHQH